jgi:cytochrome P450
MTEHYLSSVPFADAAGVYVFLTAIVTVAFFIYQTIKPIKLDGDLPCPESQFLFGFLPYFTRHHHQWPTETTRLANLYKRTWAGTIPRIPGIIMPPAIFFISQEANMKYVLQDNFENYVKGKVLENVFSDLLGEGIFAVDGSKWKTHRKLMSNMFSRNLLRNSAAVMRQKLHDALQDMENTINASETRTGPSDNHCRKNAEIDMKDLLLRLLFDVTSKIAFGVDLNTVSKSNSTKDDQHPFFTAFDEMSCVIYNRLSDPLFAMKRRLGIGSEKHTAKLICTIDDFAMGVIAERRMNVEKGIHIPASGASGTGGASTGGDFDLLTKYIEYAQKEKEEVSDRDLRDVILSVMLAGEFELEYLLICRLTWPNRSQHFIILFQKVVIHQQVLYRGHFTSSIETHM